MIANVLLQRAATATAALAYLAIVTAWVYGGVERQRDALEWSWLQGWRPLLAVVFLHAALGLAVGRPWALALPLGAVLIAVPAADFPGGYPEVPVWVWLGFTLAWAGVPALLGGIVLGAAVRRRGDRAPSAA